MKANFKYPPKGLIYIVEQTSKSLQYKDYSEQFLKSTFFGGFNEPFLNETSEKSGQELAKASFYMANGEKNKLRKEEKNKSKGVGENKNEKEYYQGGRGLIFNIVQDVISGFKGFKFGIRYNGYQMNYFKGDPSQDNPELAPASRGEKPDWTRNGGSDTKVINSEGVMKMSFHAVSGPVVTPKLPAVVVPQGYDVRGLPPKLNFEFIEVNAKTLQQGSVVKHTIERFNPFEQKVEQNVNESQYFNHNGIVQQVNDQVRSTLENK